MNVSLDTTRDLISLFSQPTKTLSIMSDLRTNTDQIGRYLNDRALLAEVTDTTRFRLWVAVLPAGDAQFYADRLGSGLHGARVHDTVDQAIDHLCEVAL